MKHPCVEQERPQQEVAEAKVVYAGDSPGTDAEAAKRSRRKLRLAALMESSGIWAGEPGKPRDGMVYQQELRAEWL